MRDIFSYLEHQFGKNAVKVPVYRQKTKNIERFFAERDLPCKIRDDEDLLWMSARQDALMQKEMLDEQLYRSIDSMRDYMPTLHYEEVNHLLLVDFKDVLKGLKHFEYDGSEIYLPCFSPEINARSMSPPFAWKVRDTVMATWWTPAMCSSVRKGVTSRPSRSSS